MRRILFSLLLATALLAMTRSASAWSVTISGPCPGGGTWYHTSDVDDYGQVTWYGVTCSGEMYWHCGVAYIHSPTNDWGEASDYFAQNDDGAWLRYNVDPTTNMVTQAWGRCADGSYWMCDQWGDSNGGGGIN